MASSNFNMKLDPVMKEQFAQVVAGYGLTVPQAFKLFANQAIHTGVLPLSFDYRSRELIIGKETEQALKQGSADYQAGKLERFSADDAIDAIAELAHD